MKPFLEFRYAIISLFTIIFYTMIIMQIDEAKYGLAFSLFWFVGFMCLLRIVDNHKNKEK